MLKERWEKQGEYKPADPVFVHLPIRAILSVEDIVGV
jgi:hypothetical protein